MTTQMLPTPSTHSLTCDFRGVEGERPSVVGGRELVAVDLLRSRRAVVRHVVAHRRLRLPRVGIQPEPEDARAYIGVELPRLDVDSAGAAEKWSCVAIRGGDDRLGAQHRDRKVLCWIEHLRLDRHLVARGAWRGGRTGLRSRRW